MCQSKPVDTLAFVFVVVFVWFECLSLHGDSANNKCILYMKIIINPEFRHLHKFIESLPRIFHETGTSIYKGRNELKEYEVDGIRLVVKSYRKPILVNRFVYAYIRPSKARRAYEYGLKVIEKGVDTPRPVAYVEVYKNGLLTESYFISLKCDYSRLMREFCEEYPDSDKDVLVAFAQFTANMHNAGIYHKDYSAGNILFEKDEKGIRFSIVDINRMKFGFVTEETGYENFYRLWFKDKAFRIVGKEYGKARGFDPEKALNRVLYYKNKFMNSCK